MIVLRREGLREGNHHLAADITDEVCDTEEALLRKTFDVLLDYPLSLTFNGDDFDLRYLVHRAMSTKVSEEARFP